MSRVWTVTKKKGTQIELPKDMADGDTIEICGDQLEERSAEAEPDSFGAIKVYLDDFGVFSNFDETCFHLVFKNGQRDIYGTFSRGRVLSIDAPDVVKVDDFAFSEAERLEELHLPSLRYIGKGAFHDCPRLKPFRITRDVEHIGDGAFTGCPLIKSFDVDPDNAHYESVGGGLYRKADDEGGRRMLVSWAAGCTDARVDVDGDVGERAFQGATYLEDIRLVNAVSLGHYAFARCKSVRRICLPATLTDLSLASFGILVGADSKWRSSLTAYEVDPGNPIMASKDGVIYTKDMKHLLVYPQRRSDEDFADDDVEVVRSGAFNCCHSIKRVSLPNVRKIEVGAFFRCRHLMSLSLPRIEEIRVDDEDPYGSVSVIEMCPARLIRIGKEPPLNARHLVGPTLCDEYGRTVHDIVLVPDLSRYTDFMPSHEKGSTNTNDEAPIYGLTELPEGGAFGVYEPLKSVIQLRIGDEVTTDISTRVVQLVRLAEHEVSQLVFYDPQKTLRSRRLKRHQMRKFINKTKRFLRELRTLHPDAYAEVELTVEHNLTWDENWGDGRGSKEIEPPRGCSPDHPYWEIQLLLAINRPRQYLGRGPRTWICGSTVQEHIRDDLSWLWEELGHTDFKRRVDVWNDDLSWDVKEVLGIEEEAWR